jgi:hypothetical protein
MKKYINTNQYETIFYAVSEGQVIGFSTDIMSLCAMLDYQGICVPIEKSTVSLEELIGLRRQFRELFVKLDRKIGE